MSENVFQETDDLREDEEDRDGTAPGVHGHQVTGGDGVQVPGGEEADHQAGEGDQGKQDVEEGGTAGKAAAGAGVHQHPLPHTVHRPKHHHQRVEAPHQFDVSSHPVHRQVQAVLQQPVEEDRQEGVEEELSEEADEVEPAGPATGTGGGRL